MLIFALKKIMTKSCNEVMKRDVSHPTNTRGHFCTDFKSVGQMTWRLLKKKEQMSPCKVNRMDQR